MQYLSISYTERLAEAGIVPSVGSVGDSYDNALAETVIGLFKAEVIHRLGPWRSLEAVEFATLEWVDWFNNRRLLEPIGNVPPPRPKTATTPSWKPAMSRRRTQTNLPPGNPARFSRRCRPRVEPALPRWCRLSPTASAYPDQLARVGGVVGQVVRQDDLRLRVHRGLGIVGLHEAVVALHDPALRIGEVALILVLGRPGRRLGLGLRP